ncbi:MAG: hypothetical protein LBV68_06605 [Spirochaetaceae bacterium]|jgi:hypothetical protein|nr:hypothetical protein [Spirochaetaceae bacterium]
MLESAKRDPKAPKFLQITIKDSEGKEWCTTIALPKDFSSGSTGCYVT